MKSIPMESGGDLLESNIKSSVLFSIYLAGGILPKSEVEKLFAEAKEVMDKLLEEKKDDV